MVRLVRNTVFFGSLLFVVYTLVLVLLVQIDRQGQLGHNAIYPRAGNGHSLLRFQELDTVGAVDVLVLGSSHAYRSFDPRMFAEQGLRMFNLGSSSQTPLQTQVLLQAYLKQLQPKMVIWVVNPDVFLSDGVESSLDLTANLPWEYVSSLWLWETKDLRTFNALYYRWIMHFFESWKDSVQPKTIKYDTYISGGYVLRLEDGPFVATQAVVDSRLNPNQLEAFKNCQDMLSGYPVLLVETPVTQDYYKGYANRKAYERLFTRLLYFNANAHFQYPDSLFYDSQHLNARGVEQFFFDLKNEFPSKLK